MNKFDYLVAAADLILLPLIEVSKVTKKKANVPRKKQSPPPKENHPKAGNEAGDGEPSPVTGKKSVSRKRKKTDANEHQTFDVQREKEKGTPKMARRSISSEDSLHVEVRQWGDSCVPVAYTGHCFAVPPGVVPKQEPTPSTSAVDDDSASSGISLEEPAVVREHLGWDDDNLNLPGMAYQRKKEVEIPQHDKDLAETYIREMQSKKDRTLPLVCKMCNTGKVFTAASSLLNHYRSHTGIKRFKCHHCGQSFTRKLSLIYHKMVHDDIFLYECETCKWRFRQKDHYTKHLKTHTGETPFVCDECDPPARYKTRNTYKRHLKTHHGKILSRTGTIELSEEELAKVRTKKYKTSSATSSASGKSSSSSVSSSSPKEEPEELKPPTQQTPLPRVGAILSGLNHVTSQMSLGILPHLRAVQAAAPGNLGMNTASHGSVDCLPSPVQTFILVPEVTLGTGQPATLSASQAASIIVCQAPTRAVCQPTSIDSREAQEQTYNTTTGFAPGMVVGSAPSLHGAQPASRQESGSGDTDLSHYKLG